MERENGSMMRVTNVVGQDSSSHRARVVEAFMQQAGINSSSLTSQQPRPQPHRKPLGQAREESEPKSSTSLECAAPTANAPGGMESHPPAGVHHLGKLHETSLPGVHGKQRWSHA